MKEYNFPKLEKKLKKYMDEERFIHTQGVMYTACALGHVPQCRYEPGTSGRTAP